MPKNVTSTAHKNNVAAVLKIHPLSIDSFSSTFQRNIMNENELGFHFEIKPARQMFHQGIEIEKGKSVALQTNLKQKIQQATESIDVGFTILIF